MTAPRPSPALILLVLVVPVLTGCLTGLGDQAADPTVVIPSTCDPDVVANCEAAAKDPTLPWIVEDLTLEGGPEANVGLMVEDPSHDLLIRDVHITGYTVAIRVGGPSPFADARCPTCTIRVENATLRAAPPASTPGLTAIGIGTNVDLESVIIRNVTITTTAGQPSTIYPSQDDQLAVSRATGVSLDMNLTRFAFTNLSITDTTGHGGFAIDAVTNDSWTGHGLTARGYQLAVDALSSAISLSDVEIECGYRGLDVSDSRLELSDVRVRNCTETGIHAFGGSPSLEPGDGVFLEDIQVSGSNVGVKLLEGHTEMTDFVLDGNHVGLKTNPDGFLLSTTMVYRDGAVTNNSVAGMHTVQRNFTVRNVTFRENAWDGPTSGAALRVAVSRPSQADRIVIRNSTFEDNLFGVRSLAAVDARHNWWGSPWGPRVWAGPGTPPATMGEGDAVSPTVVFAPYRSGPIETPSPILA